MEKQDFKRVEYYVSKYYCRDAGFDELEEKDYEKSTGLLLGTENRLCFINGNPVSVTYARIKDDISGEEVVVKAENIEKHID